MGRKSREEAALRALARKVWGDSYYERHTATSGASGTRTSRRHHLTAIAGIGVGAPLLLSALGMVAFSTAASAHTSTIEISCTQVQFVYQNFEAVLATAHESVSIDGVQVAQRDITFNGPSATDAIPITVPSGTHSVTANDEWFYSGQKQGQAYASASLSYCGPGPTTTTTCPPSSTTTAPATTTSTVPATTTSTTEPETSTSTTVPETTTTNPETTTTTVPETSTTIATETTTTIPATSTTIGEDTTTSIPGSNSTSTTTPVGPEGSTSTSTPVGPQGSTSPPSTTITPTPPGNLPFTGSGPFPLVGALAALGVGMLAVGLTSLRRVVDHH